MATIIVRETLVRYTASCTGLLHGANGLRPACLTFRDKFFTRRSLDVSVTVFFGFVTCRLSVNVEASEIEAASQEVACLVLETVAEATSGLAAALQYNFAPVESLVLAINLGALAATILEIPLSDTVWPTNMSFWYLNSRLSSDAFLCAHRFIVFSVHALLVNESKRLCALVFLLFEHSVGA
jgi:hypothetical protein